MLHGSVFLSKIHDNIRVLLHYKTQRRLVFVLVLRGSHKNQQACETALIRFDSGLRHLVKVLQTLVNGGFEAFFILFEKLYKVVQSVNTRLTPISLPFARYLFLLHADRYNVAS